MDIIKNKKESAEAFFKEAFCADSAELLLGQDELFKISGVIKIDTGDKRGMIYVANVQPINPLR